MIREPAAMASTIPQVETDEPIYFWREHSSPHGYMSQWYHSPFTCPSTTTTYKTAEQYMMHRKALLFSDPTIAAQILTTTSPKAQKALGRKVKNFEQKVWEEERERIVEEGTWLKFRYGVDRGELEGEGVSLRERLVGTGERELVEASPMDRIWGIGFTEKRAGEMRDKWGMNLLGKALMKVRERLRAEEVGDGEEDVKKDGEKEVEKAPEFRAGKDNEVKENDHHGQDEEERPKKRTRSGKV
ncbi:DUF1768-domain-containing protein [Mollisia scopiformis]|uniref:DUF1768-domain-containing protein n=1 Tax=Mollisia scopiformis TaxID=149040 RepID=A0A132B7Q6_MOLSC|nr:DUF1768-domain-containing protein [Mollisia scopiformis]KUJ08019.1 DUF1768-domain-containing protein [Mollisia scopiformis]